MSRSEQSRREYIARINRVMDYTDNHLQDNIDLNVLASVAGFSPFHFHQIFSAMIGEPINAYVRRIRAEKAARMLLNYPDMPVSKVSDLCGYTSMPVFCRTFREVFSVSAVDFRMIKGDELSKIRQSLSKEGQLSQKTDADLCFVKSNEERKISMKTNIEVKEMPALKLLYVRHTSAFDQIGAAYGKLMQWAGPCGLLQSQISKRPLCITMTLR